MWSNDEKTGRTSTPFSFSKYQADRALIQNERCDAGGHSAGQMVDSLRIRNAPAASKKIEPQAHTYAYLDGPYGQPVIAGKLVGSRNMTSG